MEKKRGFGWLLVSSLASIFAAAAISFILDERASGIVQVLLTFGIPGFIMYWIIYIYSRTGKVDMVKDERSERINEKAGYKAWMATVTTAVLLTIFIDVFKPSAIPVFGAMEGLQITAVIGFVSFVMYRLYYNQKGE